MAGGPQVAPVPPLPMWPPSGVELHHASRSHPQQTTVLGMSSIDDEELDWMVKEGNIPSRAVAWSPLDEEVSEPFSHEFVVFEAFFEGGLGFPSVSLL